MYDIRELAHALGLRTTAEAAASAGVPLDVLADLATMDSHPAFVLYVANQRAPLYTLEDVEELGGALR